jgi:TRAP transporter TAXI family solute receptor
MQITRGYRLLATVLMVALLMALAAGCGGKTADNSSKQGAATAKKNYSIVSSATGGLWYAMVGAAASLWTDKVPGITVAVEGTGGSVENARRFVSGEADFGMLHATHMVDMYKGTGILKGKAGDSAQVMCLAYDSPHYFVTLKSKSIRTMQDLKGKKVVLGAPGSGAADQSKTALRVLGIEVNGIEMQTADGARELQEGRVDAIGQSGALAAGLMELAATKEIFIIPFSDEEIGKMSAYSPWYFKGKLPAGTYKGQDKDVPTFAFPVLLCANKNVPADVVYQIMKATFAPEGLKFLKTSHAQWDPTNNPDVVKRIGAKYHPGAEKYWNEKK